MLYIIFDNEKEAKDYVLEALSKGVYVSRYYAVPGRLNPENIQYCIETDVDKSIRRAESWN